MYAKDYGGDRETQIAPATLFVIITQWLSLSVG